MDAKIQWKEGIKGWANVSEKLGAVAVGLVEHSAGHNGVPVWCTVYTGDTIVKPFFDFDSAYDPDERPSDEELAELYDTWTSYLKRLMTKCKLADSVDDVDVATATRTRLKSPEVFHVSMRAVVQGCTTDVRTVGALARVLVTHVPSLVDVLDLSIYKRGQHGMAAVGCRKWEDVDGPDEILRPITGHPYECFIETIVPTDAKEYRMSSVNMAKYSPFTMADTAETSAYTPGPPVDARRVVRLLNLIKLGSSDYAKWIKVGMNVKAALGEGGVGVFDQWSSTQPGYQDTYDVQDAWRTLEPTQCGNGMQALAKKARDDAPQAYEELMKSDWTLEDRRLAPFGYVEEAVDILDGKIRDYQFVKAEFEKTHFFALAEVEYVVIKHDFTLSHYTQRQFQIAYQHLRVMKDEKEKEFTSIWFCDPQKRVHSCIQFAPPPAPLEPKAYNSFTGFAADLVPIDVDDDSGSHELFLELLSLMARRDHLSFDYMLKFFAHLVQFPGDQSTNVMMFLYSPDFVQGVGKSMFLSQFGQNIIGKKYFFETASYEDIVGGHAIGLLNKLLVLFEEATQTATSKNRSSLYHAISGEFVNINEKYMRQKTLSNFVRIVSTTNWANAIAAGRRFFATTCSFEKHQQPEYFAKYKLYMRVPANQRAIITYLRSIDLKDWHAEGSMPVTDIMEINAAVSAPPEALFLYSVCCDMLNKNEAKRTVANTDLVESYIKKYELASPDDRITETMRVSWSRKLPGKLRDHKDAAGDASITFDKLHNLLNWTFNARLLRKYLEKRFHLTIEGHDPVGIECFIRD